MTNKLGLSNGQCYVRSFLAFLTVSLALPPALWAVDLFPRGAEETFRIRNTSGGEVSLVLLSEAPRIANLLTRTARSLETNAEIRNRMVVENQITIPFKGLALIPVEGNANRLAVRYIGEALEARYSETISKESFLREEWQELTTTSTFSVTLVGELSSTHTIKFRWDATEERVEFDRIHTGITFTPSLGSATASEDSVPNAQAPTVRARGIRGEVPRRPLKG